MCVVCFGIKFKAIWAACENLKQDKGRRVGPDYVHPFLTFMFYAQRQACGTPSSDKLLMLLVAIDCEC